MSRFEALPTVAVPVMDHPSFGPLRASGSADGHSWRWEALELIETQCGQADLSFAAGPDGPGRDHEHQFTALVDELDQLTAAAVPGISSVVGECLELSRHDPWATLEWEGAHLTGKDGAFELHYACKTWPDAMITVRFEQSRPVVVELDD